MTSDDVIDRLWGCSIDDTVIAIVQDGSRVEGQISAVDHTDRSDDGAEMLAMSVTVTEGTIERHSLVPDTVELRGERETDDSWSDVELVAWEPSMDRLVTGVDVQGGQWHRLGIVDQLLTI